MTIGWVPDLKAIRIIIVQGIYTFVEVISTLSLLENIIFIALKECLVFLIK